MIGSNLGGRHALNDRGRPAARGQGSILQCGDKAHKPLGRHATIESKVRYRGVDVEDALELAERTEYDVTARSSPDGDTSKAAATLHARPAHEVWADKAALDTHGAPPNLTSLAAQFDELLSEPLQLETLQRLD